MKHLIIDPIFSKSGFFYQKNIQKYILKFKELLGLLSLVFIGFKLSLLLRYLLKYSPA